VLCHGVVDPHVVDVGAQQPAEEFQGLFLVIAHGFVARGQLEFDVRGGDQHAGGDAVGSGEAVDEVGVAGHAPGGKAVELQGRVAQNEHPGLDLALLVRRLGYGELLILRGGGGDVIGRLLLFLKILEAAQAEMDAVAAHAAQAAHEGGRPHEFFPRRKRVGVPARDAVREVLQEQGPDRKFRGGLQVAVLQGGESRLRQEDRQRAHGDEDGEEAHGGKGVPGVIAVYFHGVISLNHSAFFARVARRPPLRVVRSPKTGSR